MTDSEKKIEEYQNIIQSEIETAIYDLKCIKSGLQLAKHCTITLEFNHNVKVDNSEYIQEFKKHLYILERMVEEL